MSDAAWEEEFAKYQTSPEYQQVNSAFTIHDFKRIFWMEWFHRLLGRITGAVFLLPLLYFAARRQIDKPLALHMSIAVVLVSMQGGVGWVMVASGLIDDPRVSPVKLASHLSLAFLLFSWVMWAWWRLQGSARSSTHTRCAALSARLLTLVVAVQIVFGAFVAGWDAGLIYNTWPLMDGMWVPPYLMQLQPWYENMLSHIPMVQWQHRSFAYVVLLVSLIHCAQAWRGASVQHRKYLRMLLAVVLTQMALGILTLIMVVPLAPASAHQLLALVLLCCAVHQCYIFPLRRERGLQFDESHVIVPAKEAELP
jgi:cytochrome c oxidase assembly protein subunit 15